MKRFSITIALLALMALPAFGQRASRIVDVNGSFTLTIGADGVDSTGSRTGGLVAMKREQLIWSSVYDAKMYDAIIGTIYAGNFTSADSTITGVGLADTTIVFVRVEYPYHTVVLYTDTLYPPDSAFFKFGLDDLTAGAATRIDDTAIGYLYLPDTTLTEWPLMNHIYYTVFSTDTSGVSGAVTQQLGHWLRLVEWATGDLGR